MPFLTAIDANGGNTQIGVTACGSVFQLGALPNGGLVATCIGTGYQVSAWISTAANPLVFTKAAEFDRTTLGVSAGNINNAAYGLLTLADNSVLFLMGHINGGVKSIKLPPGGTAFEAPVSIATVTSGDVRNAFVTAQSPGAGVLAFSDGVAVKVASTTNGNTWTLTPGLVAGANTAITSPVVRVDAAGNFYVSALNALSNATTTVVGKGTGASWTTTSSLADRTQTMAVTPDGTKVILHNLTNGKVWVSTDSGMTFPAATSPTATSTSLAAPLGLGAFAFSDGSHGIVTVTGVAGAITANWCISTNLSTWTCATGPGEAHIVSGGYPVAATLAANGVVWAASPRGIGKLK